MAHINYRRKNPRNPNHHCYYSMPCGHSRWYQRVAWKKARQYVRACISHERYDAVPTKYPRNILYDYW